MWETLRLRHVWTSFARNLATADFFHPGPSFDVAAALSTGDPRSSQYCQGHVNCCPESRYRMNSEGCTTSCHCACADLFHSSVVRAAPSYGCADVIGHEDQWIQETISQQKVLTNRPVLGQCLVEGLVAGPTFAICG
jgi:hypothetical protein